jgi:hypothetical protein
LRNTTRRTLADVPDTNEKLRALRMKYNAAYAAHQALAMQLAEAAMAGARPSDALQDGEKRAALELAEARENLRVAMADSVDDKPSS